MDLFATRQSYGSLLCFLTGALVLYVPSVVPLSALVEDQHQFRDALGNKDVTEIKLIADIRLTDDLLWSLPPVHISRNLTIHSDAFHQVDLSYSSADVVLDPGVTLLIYRVVIYRANVRLSHNLQFLAWSPGGRVIFQDAIRYQSVCLPPYVRANYLSSAARPPAFNGTQQYIVENGTGWCHPVSGRCFSPRQVAADVILEGPNSPEDNEGGYLIIYDNTHFVCGQFATKECLTQLGDSECLKRERLRLEKRKSKAPDNLAVILPTVLGTLAVMAAGIMGGCWCWRRSRLHSSKGGQDTSVGALVPRVPPGSPQLSSGRPSGEAADDLLVCPEGIGLGPLIGYGSFGRVYQGTWKGNRVAVKVICHKPDMAVRISREVQLSLSFEDPHVVRTLHVESPVARASDTMQGKTISTGGRQSSSAEETATKLMAQLAVKLSGSRNGRKPPPDVAVLQQDVMRASDTGIQGYLAEGGPSTSAETPSSFFSNVVAVLAQEAEAVDNSIAMTIIPNVGEGGSSSTMNSVLSRGSSRYGFRHMNSSYFQQIWIVQEFGDQGSLARAIENRRFFEMGGTSLDLRAVLLRVRDIARGVAYLHSKSICHGDLKPDNVLLFSDPSDYQGCMAKVADFGMSQALSTGRSHLSTRSYGTVTYMPPELLVHGHLQPSVDVYSFGMLMWEIAHAQAPFATMRHGEVVQKVVVENMRPSFNSSLPREYCNLISRCWQKDPQQRPRFMEIIKELSQMLENVGALQRETQGGTRPWIETL